MSNKQWVRITPVQNIPLREGRSVNISGRDIAIFAALGLGVLGNHLLTLFGLRYIGAGAAGVIIGASPAIQAFLSSVLIGDVPFRLVWGGCAVSFAGVFLMVGLKGEAAAGGQLWLGAALVLLAQVSWALYSIGGRRTMERFSPLTVNWTTLAFSILPQILLLGINQKALTVGLGTVPFADWLVVGYLIVFATALGQQAWLYGVQGIGPSRAGVFVNLMTTLPALVLFVQYGLLDSWQYFTGDGVPLRLGGLVALELPVNLWCPLPVTRIVSSTCSPPKPSS